MKLKTYRASSMADALAAVKKDLGRDAVILHTRQVRAGGFLGFRRQTFVEVTASDQPPKALRAGAQPAAPTASTPTRTASTAPRADRAAERTPQLQALAAALAGSTYRAAQAAAGPASTPPAPERGSPERAPLDRAPLDRTIAEIKPAAPSPAPIAPPTPAPAEPERMTVRQRRAADADPAARPAPTVTTPPAAAPQSPTAADDRLYRELQDIKTLVHHVLTSGPTPAHWSVGHAAPGASSGGAGGMNSAPHAGPAGPMLPTGGMSSPLFDHYLRLLSAAVSRDIAESVIGAVRDELSPAELADPAVVRTAVLRHLAALIPIADSTIKPGATPDGRPLTIALVGPTGVGKTTTIAKLAAAYKLRQGRSVALITTDTYRIAAVDQLRTYATILGVPVKVVQTPGEIEHALACLANFQVVLIDTAGRSQHASDRLAELAEFLAAADPHETHLVLSSTAAESVLVRTAQSFQAAGIRFNRLILSKLDEAVNFGVLVNVARQLSARLAFVTTGQEVPEHIEPGRPDRLARMILDNALPPAAPPNTPGASRAAHRAPTPAAPAPADTTPADTTPAITIADEHAALLAAPLPA